MSTCVQPKTVSLPYEAGGSYKTTCGKPATHRDETDRSLCSLHFRNWYFKRYHILPSEDEWWQYYLGGGDKDNYKKYMSLPEEWQPRVTRKQHRQIQLRK